MTQYTIRVNGQKKRVSANEGDSLLWILREQLGLTGTKYGCGIAQCGACTVHLDGKPARSCSVTVENAQDKKITTIEGLSRSFNKEYWNYAKLISGILRHGMPLHFVVDLVDNLQLDWPNFPRSDAMQIATVLLNFDDPNYQLIRVMLSALSDHLNFGAMPSQLFRMRRVDHSRTQRRLE